MNDAFGSSLLAFAAAISLIVELTPGPNMAYLAALSLVKGWRARAAAVAGVALGLSVYGIAAALGLAARVERYVVVLRDTALDGHRLFAMARMGGLVGRHGRYQASGVVYNILVIGYMWDTDRRSGTTTSPGRPGTGGLQ
jgi:LysE type translocator